MLPGIPSLHVFGSNDHVVSASKSQRVADIFRRSAVRPLLLVTATIGGVDLTL